MDGKAQFEAIYSKDSYDPWDDMLLQVSNLAMDPKGGEEAMRVLRTRHPVAAENLRRSL